MIIVKYKDAELTCRTIQEAVEFVVKLNVAMTQAITIDDSKLSSDKLKKLLGNQTLPIDSSEPALFGWPDCATCPNRPDPNNPTFGDSPCTFCKKHLPTCKE